jgi:telomerase Cajal body protein 1
VAPFAKGSIREPIRAFSAYPFYDLSESHTTIALISIPDQPIRLVNTLYDGLSIVSSFPYVKPETEAFVSPYSLTFTPDGTHFIAGADSEISVFDVYRNGSGPIETYRYKKYLPPGASNDWGPGRGIVSTLDISPQHGILAAGTFNRRLGLYSSNGRGECITVVDLQSDDSIQGFGVCQVQWSSCGSYLYVAERKSDEILIFDVRNQHRLLQRLINRDANSNMRLGFDVKDDKLFAGGLDGQVRVWSALGKADGELQPTTTWQAHDGKDYFKT